MSSLEVHRIPYKNGACAKKRFCNAKGERVRA